jgi:hypothetical protein
MKKIENIIPDIIARNKAIEKNKVLNCFVIPPRNDKILIKIPYFSKKLQK